MSAYYIDSGELHTKIFAKTSHIACMQALKQFSQKFHKTNKSTSTNVQPPTRLFPIILVNELGPRHIDSDTLFMLTSTLLLQTGLDHKYIIDRSAEKLFQELFEGHEEGHEEGFEDGDYNNREDWQT